MTREERWNKLSKVVDLYKFEELWKSGELDQLQCKGLIALEYLIRSVKG